MHWGQVTKTLEATVKMLPFLGANSEVKWFPRSLAPGSAIVSVTLPGPCSDLDLSVLRLAVILTAKWYRGKQTVPKCLILGSFYQGFLLALIFFISHLRQPLPDSKLSPCSITSTFSPRSVITAGGDFHACYKIGFLIHVFACGRSSLLVPFAKNTIPFPVTSLNNEWCEDNSFLSIELLNCQDHTHPQLTTLPTWAEDGADAWQNQETV